jgi:hypothetical protein
VEKAIKQIRDKKATVNDDVAAEVLKLLVEDGLRQITQLINNIHKTAEWHNDFMEVTMLALKTKPEATNCSNHRTISLITHTVKIAARVLKRIYVKIEGVLGEDQFEFRRGKGTKDAIGMLRLISKQTLDTDEELCACFIDWQKALDHVNWTKLMQILKGAGINWCERRLIRKLYADHSVKVQLDQEEMRSVKTGQGVR